MSEARMRMNPEADMAGREGIGAESRRSLPRTTPGRPRTVLLLVVAVRWDLEYCAREVQAIARTLHGFPFRPAMHSKRQVAFVCQTDLSAVQLMARAAPSLSAGCVERAWAFTPGADIASNEQLDRLTDLVEEAWREVRRYNARIPKRKLPTETLHRVDRHEDGRGETITRILDDHPLERRVAR